MRKVVVGLLIGSMLIVMLSTVSEMPPFGDGSNPPHNYVSSRYLSKSAAETGAVNVVSGIILDYRAFDTFGEATVIFVAVIAVISVLGKGGEKGD
jgi:multicomponent Na+:H+ antiporter subunit B